MHWKNRRSSLACLDSYDLQSIKYQPKSNEKYTLRSHTFDQPGFIVEANESRLQNLDGWQPKRRPANIKIEKQPVLSVKNEMQKGCVKAPHVSEKLRFMISQKNGTNVFITRREPENENRLQIKRKRFREGLSERGRALEPCPGNIKERQTMEK